MINVDFFQIIFQSFWIMFKSTWWLWLIAIGLPILIKLIFSLIEKLITKNSFKKHNLWSSDRELLNRIENLSHREFEEYIAELFRGLGFKAKTIGGPNDGGIDVIIEKDGKRAYVQCKLYKDKISVDRIRDFYGAIAHRFANAKCYFVTNNYFTLLAEEFARDKPIELIDGSKLIEYIKLKEKSENKQ